MKISKNGFLEIHTLCPIQFAYRTEDEEVVGTQFSDWHTESPKIPVIYLKNKQRQLYIQTK